ncbi:MbcA/ParS/Xre antitoxin family protein [Qipengyuania gaetbuli]|uniref:MbcA/ParS/Xre antitoxin family protein n=1 Tax=Qipengyuania gaetbuli TaxID=266952 RepID=UPI001C9A20C7|nr:MbcA/ParS/Xre antitoxin family protein [Qipengyuania gaetbuli]MBY6013593.1 MbcA/ParS/Xre antitoxin family protein [Qipengyuania gaetbuli]
MSENGNARGALDAVFKIARAWGLSEHEEAVILGQPDHEALRAWKDGKGPEIDKETVLRMSYVLGIFRAINTLLPIPERADAWIRKPNKAPIFDGRSALDRMTDGAIEDLKIVRQYLDAEAPPLDYPNRMFGVLKGKIEISDDFDELPDDIIATMEGR